MGYEVWRMKVMSLDVLIPYIMHYNHEKVQNTLALLVANF